MSDGAVLITGADGYLGRLLVRHLLATDDRPLLLWVRAASAAQARARCAAALGPAVTADPRVRCTGGDLTESEPFSGVDPRTVTHIVHLAAVTAFTVSEQAARSNNVDGTGRALALARRCPRLSGFCLASTLYVSGLRAGLIPEAAITGPLDFANHYESSKWAAERLALAATDLRVSIVRVATVLADDETGRTGQFNAVHNTLNLLRHGLLTMMPGEPGTPVHLTTGRQAAQVLAAASTRGAGVYHLAGGSNRVLSLGAALDIAVECFGADRAQRGPRPPRFIDLRTFSMLTGAAAGMSGSVLGAAMGSLLPFAPQLFVAKQIADDRLRALVPDLPPTDLPALFAATCAALHERRDHRAHATVAG